MRVWILLGLALLLTSPSLVVAQEAASPDAAATPQTEEERRETVRSCNTLTRQIANYEDVADRARDRDDELWEQATEQQIERLEDRRERLCPEYAKGDGGMKALMTMLGRAGRVAARLFTLGVI